jgi:hypothetical protein
MTIPTTKTTTIAIGEYPKVLIVRIMLRVMCILVLLIMLIVALMSQVPYRCVNCKEWVGFWNL